MRRFSQRYSLVTLSDINITPLLDLAFVLLIIFIIATPLIENSLDLDLPRGGKPDQELTKKDIRVVEIDRRGYLRLGGRPVTYRELNTLIGRDVRENPDLVVSIRADGEGRFKSWAAVVDLCQRHGIRRFSVATDPGNR